MNRILLTLAASTTLSFLMAGQGLAEHSHHHHHHGHHHHEMGVGNTREEMAQKCEQHLEKLKGNDVIASLSADQKAEVDYALEIAAIEAKALKDPNHKDDKRHAHSCHRHLKEVWRFIREHEKHIAREKKKEERQAMTKERQAKAEERKAEREAAEAKRKAEKAEKAASHPHGAHHAQVDGLDHGRSEGASKEEAGVEAAKPLTEEKK